MEAFFNAISYCGGLFAFGFFVGYVYCTIREWRQECRWRREAYEDYQEYLKRRSDQ